MTAVEEKFDLERMHPVWSAKYQIQTCETELKKLGETEAALAEERMVILRERDTEAPGTRTRLHDLESEIDRLQVRQDRESDKIKSLRDELPELRRQAEAKLEELVALEARGEELAEEVKTVNHELWELCAHATGSKISGLASKRARVVEELVKLPYLIRDITGYFHLSPEVRKIEIPAVDQKVVDLGKALEGLEKK